WAQGTVPTPRGPIVSRWRRTGSGRSFELTIAAPAGTSGTVAVPLLGASRVIARDGRVAWNGRQGRGARLLDGAVVFSGVTGRHTYAW
ncbi:MAG TPA: alpha-L-rhamnosidase C-terminal domain-containing protein, partial [Solirubrobacteraceae bacterium]|nr:alpha-L-rhamnosidase C-terminal domain-containing protein [Solirubrobacteraceae bacterium]